MVQNFNTFNLSQKHKPFYSSYCIVLVFVYAVTTMKRSLMNANMKAVFSGDVKCSKNKCNFSCKISIEIC